MNKQFEFMNDLDLVVMLKDLKEKNFPKDSDWIKLIQKELVDRMKKHK